MPSCFSVTSRLSFNIGLPLPLLFCLRSRFSLPKHCNKRQARQVHRKISFSFHNRNDPPTHAGCISCASAIVLTNKGSIADAHKRRSRLGTNFVRGRTTTAPSRDNSAGNERRKLFPNRIRSRRSYKDEKIQHATVAT